MTAETIKHLPKCPHHPGRIVATHPCQAVVKLPDGSRAICGYFPESNPKPALEIAPKGGDMQDVQTIDQDLSVDIDTGELAPNPSQLSLALDVPYEEQRRGNQVMTASTFNRINWLLSEGDRLTVVVKDGMYTVTHKTGWRR